MRKIIFVLIVSMFFLVSCKNNQEEWTSLAEMRNITLSAQTNGKLSKLFYKEGDSVKSGDIIAIIDTLNFFIQQKEIYAMFDELKAQRQSNMKQLEQAQNEIDYIQQKKDRISALVDAKSLPQQNLDDINSVYDKAVSQKELIEMQNNLIAAKEQQAKSKLMMVKKSINDCIIKSPIDAFINQIYYEESETVAMARPLIELIDMQETTVMIYVNQSQLARFSIGDQMKVYIDGTDQIFSGTIIKINNKSEFTPKQILTPDNRTSFVYGIKILIDESNTELKDGMPVLVRRG